MKRRPAGRWAEIENAIVGLMVISRALDCPGQFTGAVEMIDWLIGHTLIKLEEFQNEG